MTSSQSKQVAELGFEPGMSASTLPSGGLRGSRSRRSRFLPAQLLWRESTFVCCIGRESTRHRGVGLQGPDCPGSMPPSLWAPPGAGQKCRQLGLVSTGALGSSGRPGRSLSLFFPGGCHQSRWPSRATRSLTSDCSLGKTSQRGDVGKGGRAVEQGGLVAQAPGRGSRWQRYQNPNEGRTPARCPCASNFLFKFCERGLGPTTALELTLNHPSLPPIPGDVGDARRLSLT